VRYATCCILLDSHLQTPTFRFSFLATATPAMLAPKSKSVAGSGAGTGGSQSGSYLSYPFRRLSPLRETESTQALYHWCIATNVLI
jgi:hypothetical protein